MRKFVADSRWIFAIIGSLLAGLLVENVSRAAQSPAQADWQARFLAEAPAEYARLEATVGRLEMRYVCEYSYYPADGSRRITRKISNQVRTVFDDRLGGARSESSTLGSVARPGVTVDACNPQYTFEVDSQRDNPFVISQYAAKPSGEDERALWAKQLENYRGLTAEDFDGTSLLQLLKSGEITLKSSTVVGLNGKTKVRFDCDRVFKAGPKPGTYAGWVIVDPSFHWAVQSYEQHNPAGGMRRETIEYNPSISDVAFPKRIVEEDFGWYERPALQMVINFDDPQPSQAVAKDFTLESFGLEPPAGPAQQKRRNVALMILINGGLLLALVLLFVLYRRRKPKHQWVTLRAGQ